MAGSACSASQHPLCQTAGITGVHRRLHLCEHTACPAQGLPANAQPATGIMSAPRKSSTLALGPVCVKQQPVAPML